MPSPDQLWKALIQTLTLDFLAFFLPALHAEVDPSVDPVFMDKELAEVFPEEGDTGRGLSDVLIRLQRRGGNEQLVLTHVEIQGYHESAFAERMFKYFYRIRDRYGLPVTALAIFTEANVNFRPDTFAYELFGTELTYRYPTYKVLDQDEAALEADDNPFALAVLAAKRALDQPDDEKRAAFRLHLTRLMLERGYERAQIRAIFRFIGGLLYMEDVEKREEFREAVRVMTEERGLEFMTDLEELVAMKGWKRGLEEGREEGRQKGREEREREIALALLKEGLPVGQVAHVTGLTQDEVEQLASRST